MAIPKSVCDNCVNVECLWRAPTGGNDPPIMFCPDKIEKSQTNAEHIRSMSDEELAVFASDLGCHPSASLKTCRGVGHCPECWLDWLKQEVKDNE